MAIDKAGWYNRWAHKQGLTTQAPCAAVRAMANGLVDADPDMGHKTPAEAALLLHKRVLIPSPDGT